MTSPASNHPTRRLILASSSPRRRALLTEAGYTFEVDPSDIDEDDFPQHALPIDVAMHIARAKVMSVAARYRNDVVLAADTVVALGDKAIGKPDDAAHAREIVRLLSGATHIAITAVAVAIDSTHHFRITRVLSAVRLRWLTEIELERYLASGLWRGKAGGYGLQDADSIVERVVGCRTNVIGLPMTTTRGMLSEVAIEPENRKPEDRNQNRAAS